MNNALVVEHVHVTVEGKEVVHDVSFVIKGGEVHALMGQNGSGKSSLVNAIMGHPRYTITSGRILLNGHDITHAKPDERARFGLFLSQQHPPEIAGVTIATFLRAAYNATHTEPLSVLAFNKLLRAKMQELGIDYSFAKRGVNEGFSGGEKKRAEMLQLSVLEPTFVLLDEIDSGLDVDALKTVAEHIKKLCSPERGFLVVTHRSHIFSDLVPSSVHIMAHGSITKNGGPDLVRRVEAEGFATSGE